MSRKILTAMLVFAFLPLLTGCAILQPKAGETSLDRVKRVENYYNTTVRILLLARTEGKLTDADADQITKLIHVGDAALDKLNELGAANPNFTLDENSFFILLNSALDQLALYSTRYGDGPGNSSAPHSRLFDSPRHLRGPPQGWEDQPRAGRGGDGDAQTTGGRVGFDGTDSPCRSFAA